MANDNSNDPKHNSQRRGFLKVSGAGLLGALVGTKLILNGSSAFAQGGAAAAKPEEVKATDPQAVALGYSPDAKKVDTKKFPKRAGAEGAKQFCYNCQFFQASGDPKAAKQAPCQILGGKLVNHSAWCNTWTQNPKVQG